MQAMLIEDLPLTAAPKVVIQKWATFCDDMSRHIEEVLRMKPIVELVKATSSYSSFHLTCECQDPKAFLDERIWPEGSLVRWWRADKRNNPISTASNELRSDDEILATTDAAL